jgi:hypothetical protein
MSSKPQFQLAASLYVVSEASGRGILPRVSRYTAALPVLYRLSRPFTQLSPNSNDVSFEFLRTSAQPTALVHETICEQVHSRAANAMP